ncbi:uncharacterized protein LOC135959030 isoform X2 [Calliphora vicina]
MAENEECKICLALKADNTPMLNIITIDEYENLTGITLGPRKVKKIYVCNKCARDIIEAREIRNNIITSLEERKFHTMAENEECKICLALKADNTPMLNIITIDEYENLTGITLGPRKVKKIYVCNKCARDIIEAREIRNNIITSLEERKTRAQAECGNFCALNNGDITDISRHKPTELIANLIRRELESDEQGKEFVCQNCFVKIDNANKTCKKLIESLKDFQYTPKISY